MNKIHQRRIAFISLFAIGIAIASSLILYALRQNINVFVTPTQIVTGHFAPDYHFRLGGMVKKGSIVRAKNSLTTQFIVSDFHHEVVVQYTGILPDLFREGKGVIAEGDLNAKGIFNASQVLAKHDENYMPKNVYLALRDSKK